MQNRILTLLLILMGSTAFAQEVKLISEDDILSELESKNLKILMADKETAKAKADYFQSSAVFLPRISASYTATRTTNPLMAFGSKLNQEVLTQNDFNPALLNDPDGINNFATVISVEQPLINVDKFYERRAAKLKVTATELQGERFKDFMKLETRKAYMQLQMAYKQRDVIELALNTAQKHQTNAENFLEEGLIQKADILDVKIRVSELENQLVHAESQIENASDFLKFVIQSDEELTLKPIEDLKLNADLNELNSAKVKDEREDIQAMTHAVKAREKMLKASQMTYLPSLNAFGSYELYDDEFFQADANGYLIGAQLKWNIFEGAQRIGKIKAKKAELQMAEMELQNYKDESKLALQKAKREYKDALNEVKTTAISVEQAQESLRIKQDRFAEGLEKSTEVLDAEAKYSQQQLKHFNAIFKHNYTSYYLSFLTK
ncbi:TolC family protein [Psychroflexus halocasei]|uniref:Outer membrane protein TolC n=1 Tax=Psychroflexus halocasei TaxID=908615 RepID=A0A1H3VUZ2_9FLAO|nr:TolC family protein [Psychroflexus halocasei]SDZ77908.1 Outer membrane protein TolC [Psychroflexus halocasei]